MSKPDLLFITPTHPLACIEADVAHITMHALLPGYTVHILTDDWSPLPVGLANDIRLLPLARLADPDHPLHRAKRIAILGDSDQSQDTLDLITGSAAIAILATPTLHPLLIQGIQNSGNWPDAYLTWLKERGTLLSDTLAYGLQVNKRYPDAVDCHLPAFNLLGDSVARVELWTPNVELADTDQSAAPVTRMALPPYRLPDLAASKASETDGVYRIWVRAEDDAAETVSEAVRHLTEMGDAIDLTWVDIGELYTLRSATLRPDLVIDFTDTEKYSCGLLAHIALWNNLPLIIHSAGWATDISADRALKLLSSADVQTLTSAIAALKQNETLGDHYRHLAVEPKDTSTDWYSFLSAQPHPADPITTEGTAPQVMEGAFYDLATVEIEAASGGAVLVGAVPGRAIVEAAWPQINPSSSAFFLTDEIAQHIARILCVNPVFLPQRLGFESPVLCDRKALEAILPALAGNAALAIPRPEQSTARQNHPVNRLPVFKAHCSFAGTDPIEVGQHRGYDAKLGMGWYRNRHRQKLDVIIMTAGISHLEVKNTHPEYRLKLFDTIRSHTLQSGEAALIPKGKHDLVIFSLSMTPKTHGRSMSVWTLMQELEKHPLELGWYKG